jgi:hypothetical protein
MADPHAAQRAQKILVPPLLRRRPPPLPMNLKDICVCSNGLDVPLFSRGTEQAKNDLWMGDVPCVSGPAARKMMALNDPRRPCGGVLTARTRSSCVTPRPAIASESTDWIGRWKRLRLRKKK